MALLSNLISAACHLAHECLFVRYAGGMRRPSVCVTAVSVSGLYLGWGPVIILPLDFYSFLPQ